MIFVFLFIALILDPFCKGFLNEFYKDFQIWFIQFRLNQYSKKYSAGGSVKGCFKFYNLIKRAEKLGCFISVRIDSGGNGQTSMKVNLIRE
jgi:hypothetical protein